ncbi:MAG: hypothetical protein HOP28_05800 [Gemmatimonadales bacterium]|nr:hypothetical protein [Gemmatimonadales bacterium]
MFRIRCFGQLGVLRDGVALPPGAIQPRRLGLLAILASSHDRAQSRDRLAALLWPESGEERARGSLAQALYSLRKDLGADEAIQGVRELQLNPDFVESDVWEFETHRTQGSLDRATLVYAGPFLDGFQLPGLAEFDRWLEGERGTWARQHLEVVERLAVEAEKRDDRAGAVKWWRRGAGQDPHNARLTVRLMRALARSGDRAGAIRQSEIYAALLERDLELPPDPTVLKEAETIKKAEAAAHVTGDWPVPVSASTAVASPPAPVPAPAPAIPVPSHDRELSHPIYRRSRWPYAVAVVAVAVAAVAIAFRPKPQPAAVANRVLAVPLTNRTGDSTFNLVGPMVAEWITQSLSQTGLVDVIDSRTMLEATRNVNDAASLKDLAQSAGVGTLIVGSFLRDGDSLRIQVRLTDAATGSVIKEVDEVRVPASRPTLALEPLRQRVTGALAVQFDPRLHNLRATSSQPPTWEAYQEFLLGMRDFGNDYESALAHFARASELDTSYSQARLWTGSSSSNSRRYPQADSIFRSLDAMRDRLQPYDRATLDYFAGGFVYGDWERSYVAAKRMLELAPGAGHALFAVGNTANATGRPTEAVSVLKRIDRNRGWGTSWNLRILNVMARSLHRLGKYEEELAVGREMREREEALGWVRLTELRALAALGKKEELNQRIESAYALPATETSWDPFSPGEMLVEAARELNVRGDSALARTFLERARKWYTGLSPAERGRITNLRGEGRLYLTDGDWNEAARLYRSLLAIDSTSAEHQGGFGITLAHQGDTLGALRTMERLRQDRAPYRFGQPSLWAARIASTLGRREEAVGLLHQTVRGGFTRSYLLHADPTLAQVHAFPAFREFLRPRD